MRRSALAVVLVAFGGWLAWKALPFLRAERAAVWSTPTVQPTNPATLSPIKVRAGARVCLDALEFGPDARYAAVTVVTTRPSPPLRLEAQAPGYRTTARQAGGLGSNVQAVIPIDPAPRDLGGGTLCLTNEGRRAVSFYGVNQGRGSSPSTTTVDGRPLEQELSLTLLTSPSASLGGRLGDVFDHMAAFRPITGWMVWLLALLAVIGVPVALGVAVARSAAADDAPRSARLVKPPDEAREPADYASARR